MSDRPPRLEWLSGRLHHGERLLWHGSQGDRWYVRPAIGALLGTLVALASALLTSIGDVARLLSGGDADAGIALPLILGGVAILVLGHSIWKLFREREQHYAITNQRVLQCGTVTGYELYELEAREIANYSVQKTTGGKGTVRITTSFDAETDRSIMMSAAFAKREEEGIRLDMIDIDNAAGAERALEIMLRESVSS